MYSIDEKDSVEELKDVPQCSVTTPSPEIYAADDTLYLAYLMQDFPDDYAEAAASKAEAQMIGTPVALFVFYEPRALLFGPPDAETVSKHPLAERGLDSFGAFEIHDSSWVRGLQRLSAAHRVARLTTLRHYVFTFYDKTFECVASGFRFSLKFGSVAEVLQSAVKELESDERQV